MQKLLVPKQKGLIVPGRMAGPMAPAAFVDATQVWARNNGRTCRWKWIEEMGCWTINLSMKADAPIMRAYQEGRLKQDEPPTEGIPLMETDENGKWRALDLEQYGPSGIVRMLEEADVWSGRGKHSSLTEVVKDVMERNRAKREKTRRTLRDRAGDRFAEARRRVFRTPLIRGADLKPEGA